MRIVKFSGVFGIGLLLVLSILAKAPAVSADVSPGDVIDKTNWQKAEGLLPASILNWVKKGDFILNIAELNYDPKEYHPPHLLRSLEENIGKYEIGAEDVIIETKTGKAPEFIEGIPFPEIDPNDPKAGQKAVYNKDYALFSLGNLDFPLQMLWVGKGGFEREIGTKYMNVPLDGYPGGRSLSNPDRLQRYILVPVTHPYDIAGFAVLTWRYRDTRQDLNWAYIPAIRRVRRMSPANRSDSFVGTDYCVDDPYGYDGKVPLFEWRCAGTREALVPFRTLNPERLVRGKRGEWRTTPDVTPSVYGYQTEGWQGAPYAMVNCIWVKKNVYVIEAVAKDRYYNYGKQELWYDPEQFFFKYKIVYDRSGEYWKTMYIGLSGFESQDKSMRLTCVDIENIVDDRTQHSSIAEQPSKRNIWNIFAEVDMNDFTLSGFQKYCK